MFTLNVYATPAPQGSHKAFVVAGKARIVNDSKATMPWRQAIVDAAIVQMRADRTFVPFSGPVRVNTTYWLPRPKSAPKTKDIRPTKKPDLDKIQRATFDALTSAGLWTDDAIVVESHEEKFYSVGPDLKRIYDPDVHRPPGLYLEVSNVDPA